MFHQADKKGQILGMDPFFVERQDELAVIGYQQIIGVFHAFRDPFERERGTDVVFVQKVR